MTTIDSPRQRSRPVSEPRVRPQLIANGIVTSYIRDISVRRRNGAGVAAPTAPSPNRLRERSSGRRRCDGPRSSRLIVEARAPRTLTLGCPPAPIPG